MQRLYTLISLFLICISLSAQVISTNPTFPTDNQQVVITFNAALGNAGLKSFTGDVYAHTGVITDKSTSDSDWKYVKATWAVNLPVCKLTRITTDIYTLTIGSTIRQFYNVPATEKILKMAFVFRGSTGTPEGKDVGNKDMLAQVYETGINISITTPTSKFLIVQPGENIAVSVSASNNDKIDLYLNQDLVKTVNDQSLQYNLTAPTSGNYTIRALASGTGDAKSDSLKFLVYSAPVIEPLPSDLKRGANVISPTQVTLKLFAPYKNYVYLIGDFNNWMPTSLFQMKKNGDYFWLTLDNLLVNTEYAYQYLIDGNLKLADPYTNKILDPWNDKYIPTTVYPNLKPYPINKTEDLVSVFSTNTTAYNWITTSFVAPTAEKLVVYELLIRDFTANKDIKTVKDTLAYLKRLGVNAIELMPFNEFEGNDSWGYNPSFYFAPDKAYGTANDYKAFIDACHQNGIAVIMDMVLNHSYGQSSFARMYLDGGKPAANNPWYNRNSNMLNPDAQWGYDFNHESPHTKALVDSICSFWMSEYKLDGFRFDFTKGFTNTPYPANSWASEYDASRIAILKRMASEIWKRKSNAYVIFEHLSDNVEEKELANFGILLWGNSNTNYNEGTMGWTENNKSDLSWNNYKTRGWDQPHLVSYMESHDEERLMARNFLYGNTLGEYNTRIATTALSRMQLAANFFFPIPGPKMVWQFGEMGYDISIDTGGRVGQKPPKWDYLSDADRLKLFNVYATLINLKESEPVFSTTNYTLDLAGGVKKILLSQPQSDVRILGNFGMVSVNTPAEFSATGIWYNYFKGDSIDVTDVNMTIALAPGGYKLYSQKRLKGFTVRTGISNNSFSAAIVSFPNPFSETLVITNPITSQYQIKIFDLSGRLIYNTQSEFKEITIPSKNWDNGMYVLQIINRNGSGFFQKINKN